MHHLAIETYLFQRKIGVREFPKEDLRTYAGLCRDSRIYGIFKEISGDKLWLKIV